MAFNVILTFQARLCWICSRDPGLFIPWTCLTSGPLHLLIPHPGRTTLRPWHACFLLGRQFSSQSRLVTLAPYHALSHHWFYIFWVINAIFKRWTALLICMQSVFHSEKVSPSSSGTSCILFIGAPSPPWTLLIPCWSFHLLFNPHQLSGACANTPLEAVLPQCCWPVCPADSLLQLFTKYLLCARPCSILWGFISERNSKSPALERLLS